MQFIFVIPTGGLDLKGALEKQGANRCLESYWYIKGRARLKTEALVYGHVSGLRKVSLVRPRLLKGLST
jgi:hypothetical protein